MGIGSPPEQSESEGYCSHHKASALGGPPDVYSDDVFQYENVSILRPMKY